MGIGNLIETATLTGEVMKTNVKTAIGITPPLAGPEFGQLGRRKKKRSTMMVQKSITMLMMTTIRQHMIEDMLMKIVEGLKIPWSKTATLCLRYR